MEVETFNCSSTDFYFQFQEDPVYQEVPVEDIRELVRSQSLKNPERSLREKITSIFRRFSANFIHK